MTWQVNCKPKRSKPDTKLDIGALLHRGHDTGILEVAGGTEL